MRTATRRAVLGAASIALVLGLAACGDDDDGGGDASGSPSGTEAPAENGGDAAGGSGVTMEGFAFNPEELTVGAGESIPLSNEDSASHTFTVSDTDIDVEVGGGESGEATAPDEPGDYEFVCRFHSNMTGTLTVS